VLDYITVHMIRNMIIIKQRIIIGYRMFGSGDIFLV
jgi:hypothetical protein